MSTPDPFWIDTGYDRDNASDGRSRYGAYIRQGAFEPQAGSDPAVELAVFAWRQATGPVMVPGYVRCHRRILSERLERSDWDGELLACVDLLTGVPLALEGMHGWRRGTHCPRRPAATGAQWRMPS
jgi:hypothetical protein